MRPVVLVGPLAGPQTARLLADDEFAAPLRAVADLRCSTAEDDLERFAAELADADALLLTGELPVGCVGHRPRLKIVSVPATGYLSYADAPALRRLAIEVAYVPSYGDAAVAEHALALILALAKNVVPSHEAVRAGGWPQPESVQLDGEVAGVIGLGGTGRRLARMLSALGMKTLVWSRATDPARLQGTGARFAPLEEIFAVSQVISLHVALRPATTGMVTPELLGRTRPGAILVNTARAELVAPGAIEALAATGRLRVACDVFRSEPLSPAELAGLPAPVLLSPHIAYNTPQAFRALMQTAAGNIAAFLAGHPSNLVPAH